ncbi:MAG: hypothetical protein HY077_08840 [Elusimicrobia bacterium]|nr:hypothetical protein [Elusimicrobiota bacterium]
MSVKCPACGFDSPDGALFCDFCKEPFKKKAPAKVSDSEAVQELKKLPPEELIKRVPEELLKELAKEEQLPKLPPYFRALSWAFFGLWVVLGMILAALALSRYKARQVPAPGQDIPLGQPQIR